MFGSSRPPRGAVRAAGIAVALAVVAAPAGRSTAASPAFGVDSNPPVVAGDTFDYALTQTFTTTVPGHSPVVTRHDDTEKIVVSGNAEFDGRKNLIQLEYRDASSPDKASDAFVGFEAVPGATAEVLYGATSQEITKTGATHTKQNFPAGEIEDEFPEAAGLHWSDLVPSTLQGNISATLENETWSMTQYADASYVYEDAFYTDLLGLKQQVNRKRVVASNGTGSSTTTSTGENPARLSVGLPRSANGKNVLPVTFVVANSSKQPPLKAQTLDEPDWYPSHDAPPKPLANVSYVNEGLATTPPSCGLRKGIKAFDLHGTSYVLDPVIAHYTMSTEDVYDAAGLGEVCALATAYTVAYALEPPGVPGTVASTTASTTAFVLTNETGPKPLFGWAGAVRPLPVRLTLPERVRLSAAIRNP